MCMCMCIWVNIHVHAYVSGGVCTYVYICMRAVQMAKWGWGSSGGMAGVNHLCGSKPRSGQLQCPMFKVNGGLRWLFISRLLHPCWTPSANHHQPLSSSLSPLRPQGPVLKMPVHWDPFCAMCNPLKGLLLH